MAKSGQFSALLERDDREISVEVYWDFNPSENVGGHRFMDAYMDISAYEGDTEIPLTEQEKEEMREKAETFLTKEDTKVRNYPAYWN